MIGKRKANQKHYTNKNKIINIIQRLDTYNIANVFNVKI